MGTSIPIMISKIRASNMVQPRRHWSYWSGFNETTRNLGAPTLRLEINCFLIHQVETIHFCLALASPHIRLLSHQPTLIRNDLHSYNTSLYLHQPAPIFFRPASAPPRNPRMIARPAQSSSNDLCYV